MKLKNKVILFTIFIFSIFLSSCNQEEGKFVLSRYNFTNTQKYEILNQKKEDGSVDGLIPLSSFNKSLFISSNMSLSYGASFTTDSVKINQIKIANSLFNWTFLPEHFEYEATQYFGSTNLTIPNNQMLGDSFSCDIYLEDGTIINDKIINQRSNIPPLKEDVFILDNMILITNSSNTIQNIASFKSIDLDALDNASDGNFSIKLFENNKLLLDKELNLDIDNEYRLFTSSYLQKCDTILLVKKISNSANSCNLYSIKK